MKSSPDLHILSDILYNTGNIYSVLLSLYNDLIFKELNSGYKHANKNVLEDSNDIHIDISIVWACWIEPNLMLPKLTILSSRTISLIFFKSFNCPTNTYLSRIGRYIIDQMIPTVRDNVVFPLWIFIIIQLDSSLGSLI